MGGGGLYKDGELSTGSALKDSLRAGFWIFTWVSLNLALQFTNKYLDVSGFEFPILVILTGTFATFIGSAVAVFVLKLCEFPYDALMKYKVLLILVALFQALTYVLENISIVTIPLSLNQIIKATGPAFLIALSFVMYKERYSKEVLITTAVIIFGVILTVLNNPGFEIKGAAYSLASVIFAVLQTILIAKLLQDPKLNTLSIVSITSFPSTIVIIPMFFTIEYQKLLDYRGHTTTPIILVIFLALAACLYNISHFYIVRYTSALYYTIVGNAKVIVIVVASSLIFHSTYSTLNYVGIVVTLCGFISYNVVKYYENLKLAKEQTKRDIDGDVGETINSSSSVNNSDKYMKISTNGDDDDDDDLIINNSQDDLVRRNVSSSNGAQQQQIGRNEEIGILINDDNDDYQEDNENDNLVYKNYDA